MVKRNITAVGIFAIALASGLAGFTPASAASAASRSAPGVTATTIRVGIPYVDLAAVRAVGVDIDWGSVPDAFNAIINNMNAHGGINGRRIVPYIVPVNPTGSTAATTVCTQLTEDDTVFAAIGPLQATCYLEHGTPVIASIYAPGNITGVAQDFTLAPPPAAFDQVQLSAFSRQGAFKHKKVAIFGGVESDAAEAKSVEGILAKLHVPVVTTAIDSAPQGDLIASNAQVTAIAQRFESDGVNEVVAVGDGSAVWPQGLSAIQSSYNPAWIATNESDLSGQVGGDNNPTYLKNVLTSSPLTPPAQIWSKTRERSSASNSSARRTRRTTSTPTARRCPSPRSLSWGWSSLVRTWPCSLTSRRQPVRTSRSRASLAPATASRTPSFPVPPHP